MPQTDKILTCCYCGTRTIMAALRRQGHTTLVCSSCGAPLAAQKARKSTVVAAVAHTAAGCGATGVKIAKSHKSSKSKKAKYKTRKRKGMWSRVLDEAFDAIEDIFD